MARYVDVERQCRPEIAEECWGFGLDPDRDIIGGQRQGIID